MSRAFPFRFRRISALALFALLSVGCYSDTTLKLPAIFGDHMVLQRDQSDPVWGWDVPGTTVTVSIAGQVKTAVANDVGKWRVKLEPMPVSSEPLTMSIKGSAVIEVKDILVGEVWLCSGQSNMALSLNEVWNSEVEVAAMRHPGIRFVTLPNLCTQDPQEDFIGGWKPCTPENALKFSALALFYGRYLHQALGVPVGLIENSMGGAIVEAWMDRGELERDPQFAEVIAECRKFERHAMDPKSLVNHESDLTSYEKELEAWHAEKLKNPQYEVSKPHRPRDPRDFMTSRLRVGNLFNGVLRPVIGYGIKGAIWYQGEANVERANYRKLFPAMITEWRHAWNQGDFPFYWVQLPGYGEEPPDPGDSLWAVLREAQAAALTLPHTGQCVAIDLGEAHNLHPKNKLDVAARLARWALANDYGIPMPYRSPQLKGMTVAEGKATITFDFPGPGLHIETSDTVKGFAICGPDRKWFKAEAKIVGEDKVELWNGQVSEPVAVRYGWADNPGCNLYTKDELPVTPFRTDDFELPPFPKVAKPVAPHPPGNQ